MPTSAGSIRFDLIVDARKALRDIESKANALERAISDAGSKGAKTAFDDVSKSVQDSMGKAFSKVGRNLEASLAKLTKGSDTAKTKLAKVAEALSSEQEGYASLTSELFDSFSRFDDYHARFKQTTKDADALRESLSGLTGKALDSANARLKTFQARSSALVELMDDEERRQNLLIAKRDASERRLASLNGEFADAKRAARVEAIGAAFARLGAIIGTVAVAIASLTAAMLAFGYGFIASQAGMEKPIAAFERFNQTAQVLQQRMAELGAAVRAALTSAFLPFAQTVQAVALKVVNAVTNAVMAIGKAISFVTGVDFGEVLSQYADREADIALNGTSAAGAISDQAAAQKELNKTLASFDKINRLSSDTPSSGGGGSSFVPDAGAAAAWQSFKNSAMSALDNIQLPDRLLKSLENLKTRFGELSETISGGLKWAYDNVLKPLADWTWEVVVPEGIDLIADALGHLNTFFQQISDPMSRLLLMLSDLAKWLWTDILQPLGDWATNSVLPRVLDAIGTAFDIIVTVLEKLRPIAEFLWTDIIQPIAAFLGDVFVAALDVVNIALDALLGIIKQADFTEFVANLKVVRDFLADKLAIAFDAVSEVGKWLWENVLQPFGKFLEDVFAGKVEAVNVVVDAFAAAWEAVKGAAQWVWDNLLKPFGEFLGGVFTGKVDVVNVAVEAFATAWTAVKDAAKWLWDNILKPIADFFTGVFKKAIKGVTDLLSGDNALSGAFDVLSGAGKFVMDNVFTPLGDFFANIFPGDVGKSEEKVKDLSEVWNGIEEEKRLKVSVDEPKTVINTGEKSKFQKFMEEQYPDRDVKFTVSPGTKGSEVVKFYNPLSKEWKDKDASFTAQSKTGESYIEQQWKKLSGKWNDKDASFTADSSVTTVGTVSGNWSALAKPWQDKTAYMKVDGTTRSSVYGSQLSYNARANPWEDKTAYLKVDGTTRSSVSGSQTSYNARANPWADKTAYLKVDGTTRSSVSGSQLSYDARANMWKDKTAYLKVDGATRSSVSGSKKAYNDRAQFWKDKTAWFAAENGTNWDIAETNKNYHDNWYGRDAAYTNSVPDLDYWNWFKKEHDDYYNYWTGRSAIFTIDVNGEAWNDFAWKVNNSDLITGTLPLWNRSSTALPAMANGGFVKRNTPVLAVVGDNKYEGEVVAPESKMQAMADRAAANAGSHRVESLLVELIEAVRAQDTATYLDGQQIARSTVGYINQQTQQTGACPILV